MEKIVIKPQKYNIIDNIFFSSIIGGVYIWSLIEIIIHSANILFWGWLICFALSMKVLISYFIASMRTFIITEKGCQISLLWYKKLYHWEELKTKRITTYEFGKHKIISNICIELCKKNIKKLNMLPSLYCRKFHPFTFIFVCVCEKEKLGFFEKNLSGWRSLFMYGIEPDFISQLREWGVELEEITVKISGKN